MPDITYDVGRVSFVMKGAWNLATNYEKLDAVSYNGSLYIAKQDVPGGTAITNTTYWQLAAEKGDKGDTGGVDSVNGQQGDVWFPDSRQLISDGYTTDTAPFLAKGNDSDSDRFELAKKLGNTVCVNQLVDWKTTADLGITPSIDASGVVTLSGTTTTVYANVTKTYLPIVGHKYLVTSRYIANPTNQTTMYWGFFNTQSSPTAPSCLIGTSQIITMQNVSGDRTGLAGFASNTDLSGTKLQIYCIDLTLWFGSNDRIPSDLLSHPENWERYYAGSLDYNAGTLGSADGTVLKNIGRNVWDEEWVNGRWAGNNGVFNPAFSYIVASKNPIPVLPNTTYYFCIVSPLMLGREVVYYDVSDNWISDAPNMLANATFTTPSNCHYIRFNLGNAYGTTYNHNITISLYYSGESGYDTYYPYTVLAEVDTGSEVLRGVEGSRDEKLPNGTITRNRAVVDMGTLDYTYVAVTKVFYAILSPAAKFPANDNTAETAIAGGYVYQTYSALTNDLTIDKAISLRASDSTFRIRNLAYTDPAAFKAAMNGVYLEYPLATPATEQGTAFEPLVVTVKNGVLSWTNTKGIPVGHESHWFENLRKRVEDRLPDPPSGDGTYRLTCTISGGVKTYSWEA